MSPDDVPIQKRALNKAKDIRHHLGVRLGGTRSAEKEWQEKGVDSFYWKSVDHPHRDLLVQSISSYQPSSVLEIGCNTGPNLFRLAQALPGAKLVGIDVSKAAIEEGKRLFEERHLQVELRVGKAEDLSEFPDQSFDVVFTDAVLIYVDSKDIDRVLDEMIRVARRAIVMIEFNDDRASPKGSFLYKKGYWKRDYAGLLKAKGQDEGVSITKLTKDQWNDEYWSTLGALVEVKVSHG
ncbi:MAG: class I SAM-dependent methyltransferase [Methanomassiliicoccales archaeon]|nr:class I SAM-dependent methyltransferase [Methanomassiliicoccales archaeon]